LFKYCPLKSRICPHAGVYKDELYCGLNKGDLKGNRINNMTKCPYKPRKRGKR